MWRWVANKVTAGGLLLLIGLLGGCCKLDIGIRMDLEFLEFTQQELDSVLIITTEPNDLAIHRDTITNKYNTGYNVSFKWDDSNGGTLLFSDNHDLPSIIITRRDDPSFYHTITNIEATERERRIGCGQSYYRGISLMFDVLPLEYSHRTMRSIKFSLAK